MLTCVIVKLSVWVNLPPLPATPTGNRHPGPQLRGGVLFAIIGVPDRSSGALYTTGAETVKARPKRVSESVTLSLPLDPLPPAVADEHRDTQNRH